MDLPRLRSPEDLQEQGERAERIRVERVYRDYSSNPSYRRIWTGQAADFILERKWEEIGSALLGEDVVGSKARLLDLGAGSGGDCDRFRQLGLRPDRIVALDLLRDYVSEARKARGWLPALQADAALLPFPDSSFDIVYQSTMLSSVLDRGRRIRILDEIRRVLAPQGLFLSYDTRYPNPWNPNTRPVSSSEIRAAFPDCPVSARSTTPIPQLLRMLESLPRWTWRALDAVPPLRSHLLMVVRKH